MKARSAVLHLVEGVKEDLEEQSVRIDYTGAPFGFALVVGSVCVATSEHPLPLCRYAFANGALRVVHNYDLRLAEE